MHALIVQLWPRFEMALEVAQTHLAAGDRVTFLGCGGELTACWGNPQHSRSYCSKCCQQRELGLSLLEPRISSRPFLLLTEADQAELRSLQTSFDSLAELRGYVVEGFDLGMAIASGLITALRDPEFDPQQHAEMIARLVVSCWAVYRSIQNQLPKLAPDCVYVVNGRGCEVRGVLRACQGLGIRCLVIENGCDQFHYELFENTYPHDWQYIQQCMRRAWQAAAGTAERDRIACRWYEDRAAAVDRDCVSYVKDQQEGKLPDGFDPGLHNIAVFNSSEDEYACLDDTWRNPIYADQGDGLRQLRNACDGLPESVRFYLRVHPNLRGLDNPATRLCRALAGPRFCVIPAEDSASTYTLMRACRTVLTFGSTAGIEAVYWGQASVCAGMSFYRGLGGTYDPQTHDELVGLLRGPIPPKDREAALTFGHYYATYGIRYKYYKPERFMGTHLVAAGTFRDTRLEVGPFTHYLWAGVHRLPWLDAALNRRHMDRSEAVLGLRTSAPAVENAARQAGLTPQS